MGEGGRAHGRQLFAQLVCIGQTAHWFKGTFGNETRISSVELFIIKLKSPHSQLGQMFGLHFGGKGVKIGRRGHKSLVIGHWFELQVTNYKLLTTCNL